MEELNIKNDHFIKSDYYSAWQLLKLYWQSEQRLNAYLSLVVVLAMTMVMVAFDVAFSYWSNYFYDALQAYNKEKVIELVGVFIALATFFILLAVYRYYISQLFGLRWRRWLTEQLIGRWLEKRNYYYLENFDEHTDNPDQRLQEDVASLVNFSISLIIGLISAVTTFLAFIYVLWTLSGEIHLSLGNLGTLHIPGYLVWVGIL